MEQAFWSCAASLEFLFDHWDVVQPRELLVKVKALWQSWILWIWWGWRTLWSIGHKWSWFISDWLAFGLASILLSDWFIEWIALLLDLLVGVSIPRVSIVALSFSGRILFVYQFSIGLELFRASIGIHWVKLLGVAVLIWEISIKLKATILAFSILTTAISAAIVISIAPFPGLAPLSKIFIIIIRIIHLPLETLIKYRILNRKSVLIILLDFLRLPRIPPSLNVIIFMIIPFLIRKALIIRWAYVR